MRHQRATIFINRCQTISDRPNRQTAAYFLRMAAAPLEQRPQA
jgi:hypothetical protein